MVYAAVRDAGPASIRAGRHLPLCLVPALLSMLLSFDVLAATFVVTKVADTADGVCDSDCSLREAVIAANAAPGMDFIELAGSAMILTIDGNMEDSAATGDLDITDDLVIQGVSGTQSVIEAQFAADRVMHVLPGVEVELHDLGVTGGNPDGAFVQHRDGGGIYNQGGVLHMDACRVTMNAASNAGGGIANSGGTVEIFESDFLQNSAGSGGGARNFGGVMDIMNSEFAGNTATSNGGAISNTASALADGTLTASALNFSSNSASIHGGAIYNGLSGTFASTMDLSLGSFMLNMAGGAGGAINNAGGNLNLYGMQLNTNIAGAQGGGINNGGDAVIERVTFFNNEGFWGGGLHNEDGATATVRDSTFDGNSVTNRPGGGISTDGTLFVESSWFTGNEALARPDSYGGGIAVGSSGDARIVNSTLYLNDASAGGGAFSFGTLVLRNVTMYSNMPSDLHVPSVTMIASADVGNSFVGTCNCSGACSGSIISQGYNMESGIACQFTGNGDQQNSDPMFGSPGSHGGPTQTLAVDTGSPVIDSGDPAGCDDGDGAILSQDQRRLARNVDGNFDSTARCDIGAVEFDPWIDADPFALSVGLTGDGQGSVTSMPPGIACPPTCMADFPENQPVNLTATPDSAGSAFNGWSGECSGTGDCNLVMDQARSASAEFERVAHDIRVVLSGNAGGQVESTPVGIDCPGACAAFFPIGSTVDLVAIPDQGASFQNWILDCLGASACQLHMDQPANVGAVFVDDDTIFFDGLE